jgi:hypothetical protein
MKAKDNKKRLVFIGGFPSGGTDLLKNVLNAHPDIHINGEMPFLFHLSEYGIPANFKVDNDSIFIKLKKVIHKYDIWNNVENINNLIFEDCKDDNLETFFYKSFNNKNKSVWGNKTPQNTENISKLREYFPSAKFIIIIRDIRDICLSWRKKWGKDMLLTAYKWNKRNENLVNSENVHIVKYEILLQNLRETLEQICQFLEVSFHQNMLNYDKHTDVIVDGKINYGQPLIINNFNKWRDKLTHQKIKRIEEIAFNSLNKYDYMISIAKSSRKINTYEKYSGYIKDVISSFVVGNRQSKHNTIKDRLIFVFNQIKLKILR